MRLSRILLLFAGALSFLLAHPGSAHAMGGKLYGEAFRIQSEGALSSVEQQAVASFLQDVESKLPPLVKQRLGRTIHVEWTDFGQGSRLPTQCQMILQDGETKILGQTIKSIDLNKTDVIRLHRAFLPELVRGARDATKVPCSHGDYYKIAVATLLHEIMHVYDFANIQPAETLIKAEQCGKMERALARTLPECQDLAQLDRTISKDRVFLNLIGAVETGNIIKERKTGVLSRRSPDLYEFKNPDEAFAVNMEYFLLDPEYSCRRPSLYRYFSSQMGYEPFSPKTCQDNSVVPISTSQINGQLVRFVDLDPKRLYEVHYLFASQGEAAMSRWGHAMYRLVFCSPERAVPGPECLKDVSYHVVVSFRANVTDLNISSAKGLTGQYPSQLFLMSMIEVMQEYTVDELRDLVSVPLNLTREQTLAFLDHTFEMFWEYSGKYYFLSNNCATEALNLLKSVVSNERLQRLSVLSPLGLYDDLARLGLSRADVVSDEKKASVDGYLFKSDRERLLKALNGLKQFEPELEGVDLDTYIRSSTAASRQALFEKIVAQQSGQKRLQGVSRMFLIENYLLRQRQNLLLKEVAKLVLEERTSSAGRSEPIMRKADRIRAIQAEISPTGIAPRGYGIALKQDFSTILEERIGARQEEIVKLAEELKGWLETQFKDQYEELTGTLANKDAFAKRLGLLMQESR